MPAVSAPAENVRLLILDNCFSLFDDCERLDLRTI